MGGHVAIVTDSTAYLTDDMVRRYDITVVPLQVILGGDVCDEGEDVSVSEVAEALQQPSHVSTSRPSPQRFTDAYAACASAGASAVLSAHLSSDMSGTVEAARLAADEEIGRAHV